MLNKIKRLIQTSIISFMYGLKKTEEDILGQKASALSGLSSIEQKQQMNKLAQDLLKGEVTEEVEILRDRVYYVSDESKKFKVVVDTVGNSKAFRNLTQPNKPKVYEIEGYEPKIIMDNNAIPSGVIDGLNAVGGYGIKDIYPLKFTYEYNPPKFDLTQYIRKMVIKVGIDNDIMIDFYVPIFTDSFERLEKIFDNEINKVKEGKRKPNNLAFETVEFITDKAYGVDDLRKFKFKFIKLLAITEYEGKNILTYQVSQVDNDEKITDKYINQKLRDNYANNAPRTDTISLITSKTEKCKCDKCGEEVDKYDYRITKASINIGLCKKCLEKYNERQQKINEINS